MRNLDENTITDEVISRIAEDTNPRLKQIMTSLIRHAHAFIRDVQLTEAEWAFAIDFLTRVGKTCTDKRQEFILLSDTLGISMLVDAINHRMPEGATESSVLGPFYVENPPKAENGADIDRGIPGGGEALYVEGTVTTPDGRPIAGATVDVWHSDKDGFYDVQYSGGDLFRRARFVTDQDGRFSFWTTMPALYPIPHDGPVGEMLKATGRHPYRPAHVHFMIEASGYDKLVTQLFVDGDPYLDSDAVFGVKNSLICEYMQRPAGPAPDGSIRDKPFRHLVYRFGLRPTGAPASRTAA